MEEIANLEDKNLLKMLVFEQQIFLDILRTDALVVTAKYDKKNINNYLYLYIHTRFYFPEV